MSLDHVTVDHVTLCVSNICLQKTFTANASAVRMLICTQLVMYKDFDSARDSGTMDVDVDRIMSRSTAWEAVLRCRVSKVYSMYHTLCLYQRWP